MHVVVYVTTELLEDLTKKLYVLVTNKQRIYNYKRYVRT